MTTATTATAMADEYSCPVPTGATSSLLSVPYEYEVVYRPGSEIDRVILDDVRRAMLSSVARASGLMDCAVVVVGGEGEGDEGASAAMTTTTTTTSRAFGEGGWRGLRGRVRSRGRGLGEWEGRGSNSIVGLSSEHEDEIVTGASCGVEGGDGSEEEGAAEARSYTPGAAAVEDPAEEGGSRTAVPGMAGFVVVAGGGDLAGDLGIGGGDGGVSPMPRMSGIAGGLEGGDEGGGAYAFNYLSTGSLPLSRSSHTDHNPYHAPAALSGGNGMRRARRALLDEDDGNECAVVRGRMVLTTANDSLLLSYENLGGRVLDALVRDANGMRLGIPSNDAIVRVRMFDPYNKPAGEIENAYAAAAAVAESSGDDDASSSFWLEERNGVPAGMAVLVSMGCALLVLLAAFVGTSNNKRRRVGRKSPSIDNDDDDIRTYREEDVEVDLATSPPRRKKTRPIVVQRRSTAAKEAAADASSVLEDLRCAEKGRGSFEKGSTSSTDAARHGRVVDAPAAGSSAPPTGPEGRCVDDGLPGDVDDDYSVEVFSVKSAARPSPATIAPSPARRGNLADIVLGWSGDVGGATPPRSSTPGTTWTPVPHGRRVASRPRIASIDDDDEVEMEMEMEIEPARPSSQFLEFFSNLAWPKLVFGTDDACGMGGGVELELDGRDASSSPGGAGSVVDPSCGVGTAAAEQAAPFLRRLFAPHVEVEASLSPAFDLRRWEEDDVAAAAVPRVPANDGETTSKGRDGVERGDRSRVGNDAAAAADFVHPAKSNERDDLVLSPKHLGALGHTLGRVVSRGGRHEAIISEVDIREMREVVSDITTQPLVSTNRNYRSPSSLNARSSPRARHGNKKMPVPISPPRRKDEGRGEEGKEEDCVGRLEVCADGGGVEVYDAGRFCTGDMIDFFPVTWTSEK